MNGEIINDDQFFLSARLGLDFECSKCGKNFFNNGGITMYEILPATVELFTRSDEFLDLNYETEELPKLKCPKCYLNVI